jgi:predicted MPP superfamily phosphohydrolase
MVNSKLGAGSAMFRYWSGLYQKNSRALVVGNGTGNWFPVRINAPAEIIHLTLRRA